MVQIQETDWVIGGAVVGSAATEMLNNALQASIPSVGGFTGRDILAVVEVVGGIVLARSGAARDPKVFGAVVGIAANNGGYIGTRISSTLFPTTPPITSSLQIGRSPYVGPAFSPPNVAQRQGRGVNL